MVKVRVIFHKNKREKVILFDSRASHVPYTNMGNIQSRCCTLSHDDSSRAAAGCFLGRSMMFLSGAAGPRLVRALTSAQGCHGNRSSERRKKTLEIPVFFEACRVILTYLQRRHVLTTGRSARAAAASAASAAPPHPATCVGCRRGICPAQDVLGNKPSPHRSGLGQGM